MTDILLAGIIWLLVIIQGNIVTYGNAYIKELKDERDSDGPARTPHRAE